MHIEIQVALNFVISYLYNKLPRRRVNLFGEELERALRDKFNGHWYPDKPMKGSAYRCIKTGNGPIDPVLDRAARESGIPVQDILENLPQELAVWVDPAEVSYRIGEKGAVRILYSESNNTNCTNLLPINDINAALSNNSATTTPTGDEDLDTEVRKTFNPDAQCFRPIQNALGNLNLGPKTISPYQSGSNSSISPPSPPQPPTTTSRAMVSPAVQSVSPIPSSNTAPFLAARPAAPTLTFTTATFAQTKFGSTKLKTSSKRANRMSPTEFSNYIKQRALQQQQQQQVAQQQAVAAAAATFNNRPRSLSPHPQQQPPPPQGTTNAENYYFNPNGRHHYLHFPAPQYQQPADFNYKYATYLDSNTSHYFPAIQANNAATNTNGLPPSALSPNSSNTVTNTVTTPNEGQNNSDSNKQQLLDGLNFGLQPGQYQHLLVAN